MTVRVLTPRKILVASVGVASMTYVIACGGEATANHNEAGADALVADEFAVGNLAARDVGVPDTIDEFPVANLVAHPPDAGISDTATIDDFPVANLVALPD